MAATYIYTIRALNSRIWWPLVGNWDDISKCRGRKSQAIWNVLRESPLARADVPMCGRAVCTGRLGLAQSLSAHQTPLALMYQWELVADFLAPE